MAWDSMEGEILAYLADEMTAAERQAFEKRLETDAELSAALEAQKKLDIQLKGYFRQEKNREEVSELYAGFKQEPGFRLRKSWIYTAAAAVLALLITFLVVLRGGQEYCPEELYAESFTSYKAPQYAGQAPPDAQANLQSANTLFNQSNFSDALSLYQRALAVGLPLNEASEARFFQGQCQMAQKDYSAALVSFTGVGDGAYQQLGQWYSALAQLALNHPQEARLALEVIAQTSGHDREAEASAILKKWGKLKECE